MRSLLTNNAAPLAIAMIAATIIAGTPAAHAQNWIDAKNPKALFALAKTEGYAPEMISKKGEAPSFRMSVDGVNSLVLFMDCDDAKTNCKTIQFYAGYSVSDVFETDRINQWNRDKRFSRAYVDNSGDPVLEMDLDLDFNGLPRENIVESFAIWRTALGNFSKFVNGDDDQKAG